jgi:hypothetical protein
MVITSSSLANNHETIQRVATNTIGYTRKQANKEWFDEECSKVNEEKNAAKERTIQIKTRGLGGGGVKNFKKISDLFIFLHITPRTVNSCRNHTHTCQKHTLREEITLVRVNTTLGVPKSHDVKITRSVLKSHA